MYQLKRDNQQFISSYNTKTKHNSNKRSTSTEIISPVFHDVVLEYSNKGYNKIVSHLDRNLFRPSPLLLANDEIPKMSSPNNAYLLSKSLRFFGNLSENLDSKKLKLKFSKTDTQKIQLREEPEWETLINEQRKYNKIIRDSIGQIKIEEKSVKTDRQSNYFNLIKKITSRTSNKLKENEVAQEMTKSPNMKKVVLSNDSSFCSKTSNRAISPKESKTINGPNQTGSFKFLSPKVSVSICESPKAATNLKSSSRRVSILKLKGDKQATPFKTKSFNKAKTTKKRQFPNTPNKLKSPEKKKPIVIQKANTARKVKKLSSPVLSFNKRSSLGTIIGSHISAFAFFESLDKNQATSNFYESATKGEIKNFEVFFERYCQSFGLEEAKKMNKLGSN